MSGLTEPLRHVIPLAEGVEMAFRLIPPGTFRMGSRGNGADEEPVHRVVIRERFWMAETPVTQAQFRVWTEAVGEKNRNHWTDRVSHPAVDVSGYEADRYCDWLGESCRELMPQLPSGADDWMACLPTEAQWEYACRAGTETEYYTGDGEAALAEAGWFNEPWELGSGFPVRMKKPNAFHLFDMHGNVLEWCSDHLDHSAYNIRPDPWPARRWTSRDSGTDESKTSQAEREVGDRSRVLRGGAWFFDAESCRAARRIGFDMYDRNHNIGFRVCLVRRELGIEEEVLP